MILDSRPRGGSIPFQVKFRQFAPPAAKGDVTQNHMSEESLALIGNASAHESRSEDVCPSRGVFDKETRRKPLAFAADAGYGN